MKPKKEPQKVYLINKRKDKRERSLLALRKLKGVIAVGGDAVADSEKYYE